MGASKSSLGSRSGNNANYPLKRGLLDFITDWILGSSASLVVSTIQDVFLAADFCRPALIPYGISSHGTGHQSIRTASSLETGQLVTHRSPRRDRRRSRSPDERERDRDRDYRRDRSPANGNYDDSRAPPPPRGGQNDYAMSGSKENSQQDRRVYVGNLSYDVKWHHLKDFMREAGNVLFADVLLLPNGMSKGCGIVEYETKDQARVAIDTLSNKNLMGRLIYVREDRETEPRFSGPPRGGYDGGYGGRGGYGGYEGGGRGGYGGGRGGYGGRGDFSGGMGGGGGGGGRQIFVANLPYNVGWQDLKDLFRQGGSVVRADVHMSHDGQPKGTGIVAFETPEDAQNAISQFNGYAWQGRNLEVREDRFAGANTGFGGRGGYGGGRGGFGGYAGGGRGGYGGRGDFGGGYGGRGDYGSGRGGRGGYSGGGGYGAGAPAPQANPFTDFVTAGTEPSTIIYVRNLPWSTSNEDLVELFTTIGKVERAEIQYEPNGRSRGSGVCEFGSQEDAAQAISKFQGYEYGGRPLQITYARYSNAGGAIDTELSGGMQDQM